MAYSWKERKDESGLALKNQVAQVMTKDVDCDMEGVNWTLRDTGTYLAETPDIWNGTDAKTGDGGYFGGARDRRNL